MVEPTRDDLIDVESEVTEAVPPREMMSILSGSTASVVPPTTDGVGAADSAAGTATGSTQTADEIQGIPASDASGSSSQQAVSSDEDVSESFHQSDTATSQT